MTSIEPIDFKGRRIAPIEFLKAVLPDPRQPSAPRTKGKTCIGCDIVGEKGRQEEAHFFSSIYNTCDHEECYREVSSQAISYTTGVPAMIGAQNDPQRLLERSRASGTWSSTTPTPFMAELNIRGLPWGR